MSSSKKDRTTTPRLGTRPSRAKHVGDRNVAPPAGYRPAGKPKPGERAMEAQLAVAPELAPDVPSDAEDGLQPPSSPAPPPDVMGGGAGTSVIDVDVVPPADPWWTVEREKAFAMALSGIPQHQIAETLARDRHTVARWSEDERFVQRLLEENTSRFKASRQRRAMQTVKLTDKAQSLASKMLDKAIELAEKGKDELGVRLAARDWLQEFRENSRREDEIYGLAGQRVDVNVHGQVQHKHTGKVDVSFKTFLTTSLRNMGIDPDAEEVDAGRADEALGAIAERALMEGSFLDELVEREKKEQLGPVLTARER